MAKIAYQKLEDHSPVYWGLLALNAVVIVAGLGAAHVMEHRGHIVTGMTNQVVWGTPHVFAVFLIVAASGALNVASVASVFGRLEYKVHARLSGLLAIALLAGGLSVLVLDLGRPDRLIVAMTTYNFKSIFAWNIFLYTGLLAIVTAYLFVMMDRRASRSAPLGASVGWFAFVWRLVLTTGTGSIFGWLVAREAYNAAVMAPLFIAASLLYGQAFVVLLLATFGSVTGQRLMTDEIVGKFRGLLAIFALAVLYFTAIQHLTNLYASERHGVERFLLVTGGVYPAVFWIGQILVGSLLPLVILAAPTFRARRSAIVVASVLFLLGGLAQMYTIIIGGQAYPLDLFPGMQVASSFMDGQVANYRPSLPEVLLGLSGLSIAMLLAGIAVKLLPFLPKPPRVEDAARLAGDA
jgi:molybdopterin-containing oxidoreductase family membrane subunit